ncbi:MAG: SGNH/GDSL hydrolase family protein [Pseudomonadota bacterium]
MRSLLFWLSFPFLIPQALYVRQTAPRFAPASGPTTGAVGDGETVRLLAIGDSIIAGVGASELSKALVGQTARALSQQIDGQVTWQALGTSGFDCRKVLDILVPQLPDEPFDYVIVSVGVNDITGLTFLPTWRRNLSTLVETLRKHSPNAVIAVAGMPPMHGFPLLPQPLRAVFGSRARAFDDATREIVSPRDGMLYIPLHFDPDPSKFSPDGYHPSEESYVEYGAEVAERLVSA